jgi:hypothetical protein
MTVFFANIGLPLGPGFDSSWEQISQNLTVFVFSVVGDVPVDSEVLGGDFVNLEDLSTQSSKMLPGIWFVA